ncbi:uncharacterized protein PF3D7_1120000-like [Impatiens glandulifera]|uniref:uncharacterized protein PF3D7_1120000-like n=1 Tax=Impatiens glandulifera TaxID=253017 RepID=UPI001FB089F5|nr:uncharacterized protein PF3D7_1120000-like [Impatiens glandulifera]
MHPSPTTDALSPATDALSPATDAFSHATDVLFASLKKCLSSLDIFEQPIYSRILLFTASRSNTNTIQEVSTALMKCNVFNKIDESEEEKMNYCGEDFEEMGGYIYDELFEVDCRKRKNEDDSTPKPVPNRKRPLKITLAKRTEKSFSDESNQDTSRSTTHESSHVPSATTPQNNEDNSPTSQDNRVTQAQHDVKFDELRNDIKELTRDVNELKTEIKVIKEDQRVMFNHIIKLLGEIKQQKNVDSDLVEKELEFNKDVVVDGLNDDGLEFNKDVATDGFNDDGLEINKDVVADGLNDDGLEINKDVVIVDVGSEMNKDADDDMNKDVDDDVDDGLKKKKDVVDVDAGMEMNKDVDDGLDKKEDIASVDIVVENENKDNEAELKMDGNEDLSTKKKEFATKKKELGTKRKVELAKKMLEELSKTRKVELEKKKDDDVLEMTPTKFEG